MQQLRFHQAGQLLLNIGPDLALLHTADQAYACKGCWITDKVDTELDDLVLRFCRYSYCFWLMHCARPS
jgi:hypothetical protein